VALRGLLGQVQKDGRSSRGPGRRSAHRSAARGRREAAASRGSVMKSLGGFGAAGAAMIALALTAACSSSTAPPSGDVGDAGTTTSSVVKLVTSPWDASRINVAIAQILLTEQMGMTVQVTELDEFKQWDPLSTGDQHASLEVWPSGHAEDLKNYVDTGKVENGGTLGPVGKISWYVPTYMLTSYPQLSSWQSYKEVATTDLFKTPDTGNKGRFLSGDPSWVTYDADIIKNLNLNLQVVYAGSEQAELAELDAAYTKRGPMLMYLWVPHSALAKYDLTPVELPAYSDDCYAKAASGGVNCDYPADHLLKVFWPGLKDANPRAYSFLKAFSYTTKDQIALLGKISNEKATLDQAARGWIEANKTVWQGWIPK
jgi:glycine betaine/proline transport system substrate-binding protein